MIGLVAKALNRWAREAWRSKQRREGDMDKVDRHGVGKCPVMHGVSPNAISAGRSNRDWWPNQLNLRILHQHSSLSDPMGPDFVYAEAFKKLHLSAEKADLHALMTDS